MRAQGLATLPPEDLAIGGVDFSQEGVIRLLTTKLRTLTVEGTDFAVHFAPPCATFSRARHRRRNTRLRSRAHPEGIPGLQDQVHIAKLIAEHTLRLAEQAARLGALVTIERIGTPYLWPFLEKLGQGEVFEYVKVSMCLFGAAYRKDTCFRVYNGTFGKLNRRCTPLGRNLSCGN